MHKSHSRCLHRSEKMKIALILVGLCAFALAGPVKVTKKYKVEDKVSLERQRMILDLYKYVNQQTYNKEFVKIAKEFNIEDETYFTKPTVLKDFLYYYKHDMLPKGSIFSIFYDAHMREAKALFKIFYYAKDFDTFYKTAVWAREHINEGMFVYILSVAIVHRKDTYGMVMPPIYEVYPEFFFTTDVIHKAEEYKQAFDGVAPQEPDWHGYTITANYSGWYLNLHPEQSMSYFTEDIGLNSFYYYYNLHYPYWLEGEEFNMKEDRRGELYYYMHQQILARYYMERLSNNFGEIPTLNWDWPMETGFYPSMEYPNGMEFPMRPNHARLNKHWDYNHPYFSNYTDSYTYLMDYASRIRSVVDSGIIITPTGEKINIYEDVTKGMEMLGNLIEGNPDSMNPQYYGALEMFARHLIGYSYYPLHKHQLAPSVLEHYSTSLRDPAFYQMYKWIIKNVLKFKNRLPYYTKPELEFPGVKIMGMEVDRLITYFDWFYSDISNVAIMNEREYETDSFKVRVKQQRLNYKPFTYTMNVESAKVTDAIVKVFVGPKYDEYGREIDLNENRWNMFLFDKYVYKLQPGKNTIVRNSRQFTYYVSDRTTYKQLYEQVLTAMNGNQAFQVHGSETYWGMPSRLILPKGTTGGQMFQFYAMVIPYHKPTTVVEENTYPQVGEGGRYFDTLPFGYPFDRWINKETFYVPNSYFKDVMIYHRKMEEINISTA